MRILFFQQSLLQGGVERSISYLAYGLTRRGHLVAVAALHPMGAGWEEILDSRELPITIFFHETPKNAMSAASQLVSATLRLRHLLQAERIGCLCCTGGPVPPVVGWLASRGLAEVRVVWHLRGTPIPSSPHPDWRTLLLRKFCTWVSPTVPLLILSSLATHMGAQAMGYRCRRQVVIYNGVDTERFRPDPAARAAIRSEWGVSQEKKLVGMVGRLDPVKGCPVFLEAAEIMAAERDDLIFVCVGDGPEPYRDHLHRLGAELGLGERLIWAGARPYGDMPAVFNALDILCLSSHEESFGYVLAEAMSCGIPCVATRVGGVPEVIGDAGVLVPPSDSLALARGALAMLLAVPSAETLRRRVIEQFSVEAMIGAVERELMALMGCEASS